MKKKLLLSLFFYLTVHKAESQVVFCPAGAEWNYSFYSWPWQFETEKIQYIRDSILGADTVKVLAHLNLFKRFNELGGNKRTFIKQAGNKVFFRNLSTNNNWQILYDFEAQPGQGWQNNIKQLCHISTTLTMLYSTMVDSVKLVNINGFTLKRLYVTYNSQHIPAPGNFEKAIITERFGCNKFMFNFYNKGCYSDGDDFRQFLCYHDDTFGLQQFTEKPCDYIDYMGISHAGYTKGYVNIFPNPTKDLLHIQINTPSGKHIIVEITDVTGRQLAELQLSGNSKTEINTTNFAQGIYLMRIFFNNTVVETRKLVIAR